MLKYHPDIRYLTDYSAASLPVSQALCVATHLHFCNACKVRVRELNELGSALFAEQSPVAVQAQSFERLLDRIELDRAELDSTQSAIAPQPEPTLQATAEPASDLPRALASLCRNNLESLRWHHIGKHFRFAPLQLGDKQRETSLFYIAAGGSVPHHRHLGDEITVVLKGSFSDQEDKYNVGDFIVRTPGEAHKPVASQDADCLCLSTLDAPIQMSNWLLRLLMPFFNRQPA